MSNRSAAILTLAILLVACGETDAESRASSPSASIRPRPGADPSLADWFPEGAANAPQGDPHAGHSHGDEGMAEPPPEGPAPGGSMVQGTVTETMDSGGYTYMNVETSSGPVWVAASQRVVEVGSTVQASGMVMRGFRSNTLNRTFDQLVLASTVRVAPAP